MRIFGNLRFEKKSIFFGFQSSYVVYTDLKNSKNVPNNEKIND